MSPLYIPTKLFSFVFFVTSTIIPSVFCLSLGPKKEYFIFLGNKQLERKTTPQHDTASSMYFSSRCVKGDVKPQFSATISIVHSGENVEILKQEHLPCV